MATLPSADSRHPLEHESFRDLRIFLASSPTCQGYVVSPLALELWLPKTWRQKLGRSSTSRTIRMMGWALSHMDKCSPFSLTNVAEHSYLLCFSGSGVAVESKSGSRTAGRKCSTRQWGAMAWHNSGLPFSPTLPLFRRLHPKQRRPRRPS